MIHVVRGLALLVLVSLLVSTTRAGMEIPIWNVDRRFFDHPWALPTLIDAYGGFLLFYLFIFFKEPRTVTRLMWFILMMVLGNMASAVYLLIQTFRLRPDEPVANIMTVRRS